MRNPARATVRTSSPVKKPLCSNALLLISAVLLGALALHTQAQQEAGAVAAAGCTLHKGVYTCNLQAFRQRLAAARSVAVETQPMDRFTQAQLNHLVRDLGKTVTAPDQRGDLTLLLIPTETPGIEYGPAGQALATLRIYAPGGDSSRGTLLWAETWTGLPDRPWPAIVHALLDQFQERLAGH